MLGPSGTREEATVQEGRALGRAGGAGDSWVGAGRGVGRGRGLTQHALGVPGVLIPSLDPVLHGPGDLVEVHVLHCAVHTVAVVGLSRRSGPHHVSHLGVRRVVRGAAGSERGQDLGTCVVGTCT